MLDTGCRSPDDRRGKAFGARRKGKAIGFKVKGKRAKEKRHCIKA